MDGPARLLLDGVLYVEGTRVHETGAMAMRDALENGEKNPSNLSDGRSTEIPISIN